MIIKSKDIEVISVDALVPHPKNMHKHSDGQVERLCHLIEYQGFRNPLIVQKGTNLVVAGHGRLMAAEKLGLKEVPVIYQEFESEEQLYAYMVSDNAIGKDTWAELDLSQINTDLADLGPEFDLDLLGMKDFVLEPSEKYDSETEDEVPETPKEAKSKLGDLWTLGDHRLLCGDSTDVNHVDRLMDGQKADMVFTDPPYGMNLDTDYSKMISSTGHKGKKFRKVIGDGTDFKPELINAIFNVGAKERIIFGADYFAELLPKGGSWYVWDKRQSDRLEIPETLDNVFGSSFELAWSERKHRREILRVVWTAGLGQGMDEERVGKNNSPKRVHPTQKPLDLIYKFFDRIEGKNIVDLFGGSGSTLIACEKTNRKCFMMELEPLYVDVILERWAKFTGKDPVRDDGTKWSELSQP